MIELTPAEIERFWKRIDRRGPQECWLWSGELNNNGYGRFSAYRRGRVRLLAHRVARWLETGETGEGKMLLHSCDTPRCCNPGHLRIGTQVDNMRDAKAKGRASDPPHWSGETHPKARLSSSDVETIRRRYEAGGVTQGALGAEYGISQEHISKIVRRASWGATGPQERIRLAEEA